MAVFEKAAPKTRWMQRLVPRGEPLRAAFFWLSAFYIVYCARPEDWIPGLKYIPLAKISGIFAVLGLVMSAGKAKRSLRDLPKEAAYLAAIIGLLIIAALLSPVWKGGAFFKTLDFAKVLVAWVLTFVVVTSFARLRRIIFIQSASVVVIAVVSLLKGRSHPRLEGVIGGIYSNPNDLAFAIVLSLPFCVAFLLSTHSIAKKLIWTFSMLAMCTTLFLTASRGGFITLLVTGAVGLWYFGVKGKRIHLVAAAALVALVVGVSAGGRLKDRFFAISGEDLNSGMEVSAHGSYEQRRLLIIRSLEGIEHYPLGIGLGNFPSYSGTWREVHVAYLQIAVEGGFAAFVLYLLFFGRGFSNLRRLRGMAGNDEQTKLFVSALHSSLIGFGVGALFAPEAFQYFPYFAVVYTSVLLAIGKEREQLEVPRRDLSSQPQGSWRGETRACELASVRGGRAEHSRAAAALLRNQR
jgi:O-antigen ligase